LVDLRLTGNKMMTVPEELSHSKSLRYINLDKNPIMTIAASQSSNFVGPASLEELSMVHMPYLAVVGRHAFVGLDNLMVLNLSNSKIEYIAPDAFVFRNDNRQPRLMEIDLHGNHLGSLSDDTLPWESLETVNLQRNPWACDCHIKWMKNGLLQNIQDFRPKMAQDLICASPKAQLGINLMKLSEDESYDWPCPEDMPPEVDSRVYGSMVVVILFLGVLVIVVVSSIFSYFLYLKAKENHMTSRRVQYVRARLDNDLDAIPEVDEKVMTDTEEREYVPPRHHTGIYE